MLIPAETECRICKKPLVVQVDKEAAITAQEMVERLLRLAACDACRGREGYSPRPKQRELTPQASRPPYRDDD